MVRWFVLLFMFFPVVGISQSLDVDPSDLVLTIELEELAEDPYQQEMILLTIHGIYKRHITLEKLEQPDMPGINWMQLGEDQWYESLMDGKTVKNFRRRMALFPETTGEIEIGAFVHHLTLLDAQNKWFEHSIQSDPIKIVVRPAPEQDSWWFPVRRLQIQDSWSNAQDQLLEGEGVLRIIRVSALGARPDMIPPMPVLSSPSALIFPHPEKRLVDLTSKGPEAIAFWRWTIKPLNGVSTILEPIEFSYFDTSTRKAEKVVISAQRVAYLPDERTINEVLPSTEPVRLRPVVAVLSFMGAFLASMFFLVGRNKQFSQQTWRSWLEKNNLLWKLSAVVRKDDLSGARRISHALSSKFPPNNERDILLTELDKEIYGRPGKSFSLTAFHRSFRRSLR